MASSPPAFRGTRDSHKTKAITRIYILVCLEGRPSEAQMADAGWDSGQSRIQEESRGPYSPLPPIPAKPECPPLEEEIVQWPCPLIDRLSGLLRKTELLWAVLWASNMPKMLWQLGLHPVPWHWGKLTTLPRPHSGADGRDGLRGHALQTMHKKIKVSYPVTHLQGHQSYGTCPPIF